MIRFGNSVSLRDGKQTIAFAETVAEKRELLKSADGGGVFLGVDRIYARKLYTGISISAIREATGETPYLAKAVVMAAYLGAPLAMIASVIVAPFAFQWWSILVIPVVPFWWLADRSLACRGDSSIWFHEIFLIGAVSVHFIGGFLPHPWTSGFVVLFAFALWANRLLYHASGDFLESFVMRNERAFDAFAEGVIVEVREKGGTG